MNHNGTRTPMTTLQGPNQRRSLDFVADALSERKAGARSLLASLICLGACATQSAPTPPAQAPPSLQGYWQGQFTRGSSTLNVDLQFSPGDRGWDGRFSSPDLRAVGIPLRAAKQHGARAHFELVGDETTAVFDGMVTADALSGGYIEGGARGHFRFTRTPPPPTCREVPAQFSNGAVTLSGTLLLPARTPAPASVMMLHGSGGEGRDATRFEASLLCREGFAVLIYDKRGVGQSNGDWRESSFDDLASDAAAGLEWIAARPEINAAHIGVYGHSQGGTIAPLVATRWPRLAFVIAGAGAAGGMAHLERYSLYNTVDANAHTETDRREAHAYVDRVVQAAFTGRGLDTLIADAPQYANRAWYFPLPPADAYYWCFQRRLADYDSRRYWAQVRAPVLLIFGANDKRVPPEPSIAATRAALPAGTPVESLVIVDADHSYMLHPEGAAWPHLSPQFPQALLSFVRRNAAR